MSIFELDAKVDELRELRNFESEIKAAISLIEDGTRERVGELGLSLAGAFVDYYLCDAVVADIDGIGDIILKF